MRIAVCCLIGQLLICLVLLGSCSGRKEEAPVIPPETAPLSASYIGYGVITDSFTHVQADPSDNSQSLGYLRRGSLVRIIRRQTIKTGNNFQYWILTDDPQYGWLKEEVMDIYSSESQARTASLSISN